MKQVTIDKVGERMRNLADIDIFTLSTGQLGPMVLFSVRDPFEERAYWFPIFSSTQLHFTLICLKHLTMALQDSQWLWDFEICAGRDSCSEEFLNSVLKPLMNLLQDKKCSAIMMRVVEREISVITFPQRAAAETSLCYIPQGWIQGGMILWEEWGPEDYYEEICRWNKKRIKSYQE